MSDIEGSQYLNYLTCVLIKVLVRGLLMKCEYNDLLTNRLRHELFCVNQSYVHGTKKCRMILKCVSNSSDSRGGKVKGA